MGTGRSQGLSGAARRAEWSKGRGGSYCSPSLAFKLALSKEAGHWVAFQIGQVSNPKSRLAATQF
jgi:hypothetical protein